MSKVAQVEMQALAQSDQDEATVGAIGPPLGKQLTDKLLKAILQRLERLQNNHRGHLGVKRIPSGGTTQLKKQVEHHPTNRDLASYPLTE